jgi:hypothetical protein
MFVLNRTVFIVLSFNVLDLLYILAAFSLRLLLTTLTELNAIAAPAIMGSNKNPFTGYSTPAAIGIPITL